MFMACEGCKPRRSDAWMRTETPDSHRMVDEAAQGMEAPHEIYRGRSGTARKAPSTC